MYNTLQGVYRESQAHQPWDSKSYFGVVKGDFVALLSAIQKEIEANNWLFALDTEEAVPILRDVRSCYKDHSISSLQLYLYKLTPHTQGVGSKKRTFFEEKSSEFRVRQSELFPLRRVPYEGFMIDVPQESRVLLERMGHQYWNEGSSSQILTPTFQPLDPFQPCPSLFLLHPSFLSDYFAPIQPLSATTTFLPPKQVDNWKQVWEWRGKLEGADHERMGWDTYTERQHGWLVEAMVSSIRQYMTSFFPEGTVISILDIGCGTGFLLKKFLEMIDLTLKHTVSVAQAFCVELSSDFLESAKLNLKSYGERVKFIQGDIEKMGEFVEESSVDVIISHSTFQYLNNLTSVANSLKIARRALKSQVGFIWVGGWINPQLRRFEQKQRELVHQHLKNRGLASFKISPFVVSDTLAVPMRFVADVAEELGMSVDFIPESWLGYYWHGSSARYISVFY
eukprot:CAMPEP_0174277390 /NCGR_PEP_ID=MMETSP0439-20130205/60905_1 /TAXON_ID=0 /ORGANISM="Stereomyxa ramosa, Strain Chinc5" /LENGTH=451 /DNA_ID=CAMNT_0015369701 /DNA_START=1346 /DNA_END=2701 /DNA_ORIENTATION=+